MAEYKETLRRLGAERRELRGIGARHGPRHGRGLRLDQKTHALVRLGAALAIDAAPSSYQSNIELALAAGANVDEIVGTLIAVAPTVGTRTRGLGRARAGAGARLRRRGGVRGDGRGRAMSSPAGARARHRVGRRRLRRLVEQRRTIRSRCRRGLDGGRAFRLHGSKWCACRTRGEVAACRRWRRNRRRAALPSDRDPLGHPACEFQPIRSRTSLRRRASLSSMVAPFRWAPRTRTGSSRTERDLCAEVELTPFAIEAHAVTNRRFADFVDATGYTTDAERYGWSFVFAGLLPDSFPRRAASPTHRGGGRSSVRPGAVPRDHNL